MENVTDFNALFITDLCPALPDRSIRKNGKVVFVLCRYAVWGDMGKGKPEVKETSDDLQYLKDKYGEVEVVIIKQRRNHDQSNRYQKQNDA